MRSRFFAVATFVFAGAACGSGDRSSGAPSSPQGGAEGGGSGSSGGENDGGSNSGSSSGSGGSSGGSSDASDGGSGAGSSGGGQDASSGGSDGAACVDPCPAPNGGVIVGCEKRFLYGVNYAWKSWVADFGGVSAWGQSGVSKNQSAIAADLKDMQSNGVDVIRWWMLQELEGDAVAFDANGNPTGSGGTLIADIQAALDLAAQVGVHYNFTLFSFDDFRPSGSDHGATIHGLNPIIADTAKRAALMNVVKTVAQTVESSPRRDRVASWDVINEPEWAISGSDPYGDPAFSPNSGYEAATFAQMETFVSDTVSTLHANSSAPVTVGSAAIKWAKAWSKVGLDYYTFHMYDWVNQYYPYNRTLASYGVMGRPVVMGEFPLAGLAAVNGNAAVPYATMVDTLFNVGYAGAMGWAVNDTCCGSWSTLRTDVKAFADSKACATKY
jgi:hypothetical protein